MDNLRAMQHTDAAGNVISKPSAKRAHRTVMLNFYYSRTRPVESYALEIREAS